MITIEQAQEISGIGYWELDILSENLTWSKQVYTIFGVDPNTFEANLNSFLNCIHPDDRDAVRKAYHGSLETGDLYEIQHRIVLSDQSIRYVIEKCETYFDESNQPIKSVGYVQDVTDAVTARMKLEASQKKFKAISDQTAEGITVADLDGNYVFVNPAFCKMSGYSEEELLTMTVFDMKAKGQDHSSFSESKEKKAGKPIRVNLRKKDGTEYFTEIIGDVIHVNDETLVLGTIRDVSEQIQNEKLIHQLNQDLESLVKERTIQLNNTIAELSHEVEKRKVAENKIQESLQVKEMLLKEVTHRVKNNMQIISSLINLQKAQLEDESCDFLEQISHRIHSMALIHETLYKTNEFSQIQFSKYLKSLTKYIQESYKTTDISIQFKTENCILPLDIATSCGMIIIELVTNSIKYAFPNNRVGEINIVFKPHQVGTYSLTISDNGIGFPEEVDYRKTKSLGLQLVLNLVDQISGTIDLQRGNGTSFEISVPIPGE